MPDNYFWSALYFYFGMETNMPPVCNYFANSGVATCERASAVDVGGVPLCLCYFGGRANHNCDFAKNAPAMMDATVA